MGEQFSALHALWLRFLENDAIWRQDKVRVHEQHRPISIDIVQRDERRHGTNPRNCWHLIMGPVRPSGASGSELSGVAALSPTDAWAVGDYFARDHTRRALIAHWNGIAWQVVASPAAWATLSSVTAAGARNVRAVGTFYDGTNSGQATFRPWDGSAWHLIASPAPRGALSSLDVVTTDGAGTVWAVGSYRHTAVNDSFAQTLIQHSP